ncbi:MAG: acetate kinase [Clostridiales bacterium]|nr:acetate kinase [Clostridiales bacterium]
MKILVINAGSSSLKYQLIDMETEAVLAKGACERIGIDGGKLTHKAGGKTFEIEKELPNHTEAISLVLDELVDAQAGVIHSMDEIDAVGHRVVASGEAFTKTTLVTDEVMKTMDEIAELAPLHNPAAILGINACRAVMPGKKMALVFDTSFHATMPDYAHLYAIDYDDYKQYKVRKYGAHGTSHKYVAGAAAQYLKKKPENLKIITCHLGNGSSISAVDGGKCIDTSMGFTPLAGVPMGTRSGDIDVAAIEFLCRKKGMSMEEGLTYLNKKCGMAGVSGVSSDFRDLTAAEAAGNDRARLALDMFAYSCKKYVGAYMAALGGLDCIVFTAGVGENTPSVRKGVLQGLEAFGIMLDEKKNEYKNDGAIHDISAKRSKVKILVIPTNEELVIARETAALCK